MNIIRVKVIPQSNKVSVEEIGEKILRILVRESPQNNHANTAVIRAVAKYYHLPENKLCIISGHHRPSKKIKILE